MLKVWQKNSYPDRRFVKKMLWFTLVCILCTWLFFELIAQHFGIWIDTRGKRCIAQYSTYLVHKRNFSIQKGDIVAFNTHAAVTHYPLKSKFGKYVAATAGDKVVISAQGVFVNQELVATGFALTKKLNLDEISLYQQFVVAKNQWFVLGDSSDSYDSRYWGTIDSNQILGKAVPLW